MAIEKAQARSVKHAVLAGDKQVTIALDGTTTVGQVSLTGPSGKVTIQSSGTLAGNAEFSCNGVTFFGSTAFTAGTPITYSTHNVSVVKITRTGGSGQAIVLAT
jgi:hypothetical protein